MIGVYFLFGVLSRDRFIRYTQYTTTKSAPKPMTGGYYICALHLSVQTVQHDFVQRFEAGAPRQELQA